MGSSSEIKVLIFLVEPSFPSNIGACARLVENFAFSSLVLVNPQVSPLEKKARIMAPHAEEILEEAKIYPTLEEALYKENPEYTIAFSAREKREKIQIINSWHLEKHLEEKYAVAPFSSLGLIFGRERNGLTNEEIQLASSLGYIPIFGKNSSYNLAQAVAIASYEVSKFLYKKRPAFYKGKGLSSFRRASFEERELCKKKTMDLLSVLLRDSFSSRRKRWERVVEEFFLRGDFRKREISFYLGFLREIAKKLDAGTGF